MYFYEPSGLKLLVMVDKDFKTGYAQSFLETIKTELLSKFSLEELKRTPAGGLQSFKPILERELSAFNANYNDPLLVAKAKVGSLEQITVENYNRLLERNNEVDDIKNQVELITENSTLIKDNAVKLRKTTERQYWLSYAFMVIVILVRLSGHFGAFVLDPIALTMSRLTSK